MRVALVAERGGISSVELHELPDPTPAARQAVITMLGAGRSWDYRSVGLRPHTDPERQLARALWVGSH
jgi:hypothetical protein